MYITDYHHHTDNSFDSKARMGEVCEQAIAKGIREVCFTEHFSVNPKVPTYGHMNFDRYMSEIEACRAAYGGQLAIKAGIELCEPHLMRAAYREALAGVDLDFIMGSVHNIDEVKLRKFLQDKDAATVYQRYFDEVYALVSYADIDMLAHIDLMKRYAIKEKGRYVFTDFQDTLDSILQKAIERGIGLEINTSGLKSNTVQEAFPGMEILKHYRSLGGEILTIGSDSHRAETAGNYFDDALRMAKEAGFTHIYTFDNRKPHPVEID